MFFTEIGLSKYHINLIPVLTKMLYFNFSEIILIYYCKNKKVSAYKQVFCLFVY